MRGPSFTHNEHAAHQDVPIPDRAFVLFEADRRQEVEVTWGVVAEPSQDQQLRPRLLRARCYTPCMLQLPAHEVLVQSHGTGVRSSSLRFRVPTEGTRLRLRSPARALEQASEITIAAGGSTALIGLLFAGAAAAIDPQVTAPNTADVLIGSGLAMGLGLLVSSVGLSFELCSMPGIAAQRPLPARRSAVTIAPLATDTPALGVSVSAPW